MEHVQAQDLQARTNFAMTPAGNGSPRSTGEVEARQPYAGSSPSARDGLTRKRDAARAQKLRTVIRYMLERGTLATGDQVRLATHFRLSRQRVNQVVMRERALMKHESA
jgi:hypothetical protein